MMPPLNVKGFHSFDPWQIEVISNIDKNISTIVCAPTSAGKTVLSGYVGTKGKSLILCPTDPLAWQMASYYGGILDKDVPIITNTYMTIPKRDLMVELINESDTLVATPEALVDLLPLINISYDWIVFDEIHMIGKPEGSAMETIAKIFNKASFLALSATIGNVDMITQWFKSLNPNRNIANINCNKRFFNLQRYYYNPKSKENDTKENIFVTTIRPGCVDTGMYDNPIVQEAIKIAADEYNCDWRTHGARLAPPISVGQAILFALTTPAHLISINLVAKVHSNNPPQY
jgi:replicative superfamily II helicase